MSVKQKSDGKWQARYRDPAGMQRARTFQRKADAQRWEAEQKAKMRTGDWTDPNAARVTVQSVFEDWLPAANISDRTRSDYQEVWDSCIAATWARRELRRVQPADVIRWVSSLQERGLSSSRIRHAVTVLNQTMRWAVADQRLPANPVQRAKELTNGNLLPKRPPKQSNRYLSMEEVYRLAREAGPYEAMILTMAFTGLRFGEVTALRGKDVDELRSRLLVQRAFTDIRGRLVEGPPKSGKSREVPLPKSVHAALTTALQEAGAEGLLFTAPQGGPVRYANWKRNVFNPAAVRAGVLPLTPHCLRHTYAALSVQAGANPKTLQRCMGHSTIVLTLDTYGGLFDSDLDLFSDQFDQAVSLGAGVEIEQVSEGNVHQMCTDATEPIPRLRQAGED